MHTNYVPLVRFQNVFELMVFKAVLYVLCNSCSNEPVWGMNRSISNELGIQMGCSCFSRGLSLTNYSIESLINENCQSLKGPPYTLNVDMHKKIASNLKCLD